MKNYFIKSFLTVGILFSLNSVAEDVVSDLDSLGGNTDLLLKARALNPDQNLSVVQDRAVSRKNRHEFGLDYALFLTGASYLNTQTFGLSYKYSINQYFALGVSYFTARNGISSEGKNILNNDFPERLPVGRQIIPSLDPIQSGYYGLGNWSPIYGKFRVASSVVHFDFYALGGVGSVSTKKTSSTSFIYGGGVGFWLNNHWTARVELRQQTYAMKPFTGDQNLRSTVSAFSLGYML